MTPEREAEMERTANNLRNAQADKAAAVQDFTIQLKQEAQAGAAAASAANAALQMVPPKIPVPTTSLYNAPVYETADPAFVKRADPIKEALNSTPIYSPGYGEVRKVGNAALVAASKSWSRREFAISETQLKIAKGAADLLLGLDPLTGFARSGYELFYGKNLVTGEKLATWQRVIAGAIFTGSLVSVGAAASAFGAVKAVVGVLRELKPESLGAIIGTIRESEKFTEALKTLGWSEKEITKFARFQENILGSELHNFDDAVRAYKTWSAEAKATYREVFEKIKGDPEALAKEAQELGVDAETLLNRKATVTGFYNNMEAFTGNAEEISKHMRGIDLAKEVKVTTVPKGTQLVAWTNPTRPTGNYFFAHCSTTE
jgi:hypothetical protein